MSPQTEGRLDLDLRKVHINPCPRFSDFAISVVLLQLLIQGRDKIKKEKFVGINFNVNFFKRSVIIWIQSIVCQVFVTAV